MCNVHTYTIALSVDHTYTTIHSHYFTDPHNNYSTDPHSINNGDYNTHIIHMIVTKGVKRHTGVKVGAVRLTDGVTFV